MQDSARATVFSRLRSCSTTRVARQAWPVATKSSPTATADQLCEVARKIRDAVGEDFVATGHACLATLVVEQLRSLEKTVALAESCTGGLISNLVTDVAGSSDYFLFSAVTYSNEAKMKVIGVAQKTLEVHGAVHEQTALEMAVGVKKAGNADWGISTTGIAGPTGGTADKPVGTVCIGIAGPGVESAKQYIFNFGNRARNKKMFAATALEVLRRRLKAY